MTVPGADDWLGAACFEHGGLLVPGRPSRRAADLLLVPDRAELHWQGNVVVLPWDRFDGARIADPDGSRWAVVGNREGQRSGPSGSAIAVTGELRPVCTELVNRLPRSLLPSPLFYRRTRSLRERDLMALKVRRWPDERDNASRDTVRALVGVLAARPQLRARLADGRRVRRLAIEMSAAACMMANPEPPDGIRRQTMEIGTAMRALGFTHRYGRPVPGDQLPALEDAVALVMERIATNPHAVGVEIDRDRVRHFVDRRYLGVRPWPFAALTD